LGNVLQAHTHIALAILILLAATHYTGIPLHPLLVAVFLTSAMFPDVDILLDTKELSYHRRGTHTLLFCLIYGLAVTIFVRELAYFSGVYAGGPIIIILFILVWVYYKGKLGKSLKYLAGLLVVSTFLCLELSTKTIQITSKAIFLASAGGATVHILGDLVSASEGAKMKVFWPAGKKYGVSIVKTGKTSEKIVYVVIVLLIFVLLYLRGGIVWRIVETIKH